MDLTTLTKIIKDATIRSLINHFDKKIKEKKVREFQILDLIMPKERKIRSIVGGLETSMGRTLWEPLGREIAENNGFLSIKNNLSAPANMPGTLSDTLGLIIDSRENNIGTYDAQRSHDAIKEVCQRFIKLPITYFQPAPKGHGVDIWLQKDGIDYFFDTKTVQPNLGHYKGFLRQILNWYIYFYSRNPSGHAVAKIVFPYNPYNGDFWAKTKGKGKPLERTEALVEDEFWDFISGHPNTFKLIRQTFNEIYLDGSLEIHLNEIFERNKDIIQANPDKL